MRKKLKAFTLIELLVVIAIIALLIAILLPSLSRARELSKRLVCAANIKGMGTSAKIYANDNNERWMIPAFKASLVGTQGIDYLNSRGSTTGNPTDAGEIGYERWIETTSEVRGSTSAGSVAVSTTRSFWMLVRSGDITVAQFICPSSGDDVDDTENLDLYYDFQESVNISYGYQVPFGPRDTQPREGMDNRQIVSADRGPWYLDSPRATFETSGREGGNIELDDSPKNWRKFNSNNHGGRSNGEGQNCLFADGHASFQRKPAVGIDNDNIYTLMRDEWGINPYGRTHGDTPHESPQENPYPGQETLDNGPNGYASTDSLIYP